MLDRLARFSIRRRGFILLAWALLLLTAVGSVGAFGGQFALAIGQKGSDSQQAIDTIAARFPEQSNATATVIFKTDRGVHNAAVQQQIEHMAAGLVQVSQVRKITTPYEPAGAAQVSPDGRIGYVLVRFNDEASRVKAPATKAIKRIVASANKSDLQVEVAGEPLTLNEGHGTSEGTGLLAAAVILLLAFGSLAAMGLPIATALFGVAIAGCFVTLLSHVIAIPEAAVRLVAMIGIGVGIDYALLIVTRFRQERSRHSDVEEATARTLATAGRSIILAGTTVVVSLLGMVLIGVGIVQALGIAAASVVTLAMAASVTLVPALLGYFGDTLKPLAVSDGRADGNGWWYTWAKVIERAAWPVLIGGLLVMAVLAIPAFSMRLGASDASGRSPGDPLHRAYDLQSEGFGIGSNGPVIVVAKTHSPGQLAAMQRLRDAAVADSGVASVSPLVTNYAGNAAMVQIMPKTGPQDQLTVDLVKRLRSNLIPQAAAGSGLTAHVGGVTASFVDLAQTVGQRMPYFMGVVLAVSFGLLLLVFRSIVIPLKAVVLNLVSVGGAYGVLVAVFQWGWLKDWFGLGVAGPIESFLPVMLFAVLFGLSMDYEVFLLSRIREYYLLTGSNNRAIAEGLGATARVITAAAAIMVVVFASFVLGNDRVIKEFGLGLATAVFIDATVVRLMLVPATMELFGRANWWLPRWLAWLPKIGN